ncbi:hypothetical protein J2S75_004325 [Ancylobacter polymorphus]|uniref:Uncharacterized protein n=1 Tax=Ancylobacter polymorphus TaxID=223390 RepID=A0ABU0BLC8_9HYPH|nr:hypothetical protein [Ancylobacter polymorphus]
MAEAFLMPVIIVAVETVSGLLCGSDEGVGQRRAQPHLCDRQGAAASARLSRRALERLDLAEIGQELGEAPAGGGTNALLNREELYLRFI